MIYLQGISWCSDMSSIVTSVFNATIGWLVNKERDVTAERLKEGEMADQKIRDLIVREVEDINSKLEGFSRQDLLEAVDLFKTGIKYLFEAFDVKPSDQASVGITDENLSENDLEEAMTTVSAGKLAKMDFNETMKNLFFQAEKRFKRVRNKATIASLNEALKIFDRITAIRYRVMATVLESLVETVRTTGDMSPSSLKIILKNALPECEECLLKLHCLPAVQECFRVVLEKGRLGHFRKDREEKRKIVSIVCQINRVIYNMTQAAGKTWVWPFLNTGKEEVVPLRDERIREVLRKVNMEHCCVSKRPWGIATNSKVQFLIADNGDKTVKVFDSNGKFDFRFNPQTDDADTELDILDVATAGEDDRIYLLVRVKKPGAWKWESEVQVFNKTGDLQHKFPVRRRYWDRLTVSSGKQRSKILLLAGNVVDVHKPNGEFVCSFGEGVFKSATDITATCDGHVMILDRDGVFLFHVEGQQLHKFNINCLRDDYNRIACHPATEHVVLAGNERETDRLTLAIYTLNGEFVRRIQLDEELFHGVDGITVTVEGHIAVAFPDKQYSGKVIVV